MVSCCPPPCLLSLQRLGSLLQSVCAYLYCFESTFIRRCGSLCSISDLMLSPCPPPPPFLRPSLCLSVCLFLLACLSASVCHSVCLSVCRPACPFVCRLPVCFCGLSACLAVFLPPDLYAWLTIPLPVCFSACLSVCIISV